MSIFEYGFMQRAFLVGILLAVITPLIGMTVVLKRMSMVGDALAHASLAGVAIGMLFGINPVSVWWQRWQLRRFGVVFPGIQKMRLRSLCLLE